MYYLIFLLLLGCVKPFSLSSEIEFESTLIVEARLTDENTNQRVRLTKSFPLENLIITPDDFVTNAKVSVVENSANVYTYQEVEPGVYNSTTKFKAIEGNDYVLKIELSSGKKYESLAMNLPEGETQDYDVELNKEFDENGNEGVKIDIHSKGQSINNQTFYKFDYVGTYKIIAPYFRNEFLVVNSTNKPHLEVRANDIGKICYGTENSAKSLLLDSGSFTENVLAPFTLRFFKRSNPRIYHRYSIKINQRVISREAHTYYTALEEISKSDNVFSNNQPGNLSGNIKSTNNNSENVIGYFEVSKVLSKRVFFNYLDFFVRDGTIPTIDAYFEKCHITSPTIFSSSSQPLSLKQMVERDLVLFWLDIDPPIPYRPYQVVPKNCGDCSALGSVSKPSFWID